MPTLTIRKATPADTAAITALEAACFPPAEAAPFESFAARLEAFPDRFWLLFADGELISMVNGSLSNEEDLRDEMFHDTTLHDPFGVDTNSSLAKYWLRKALDNTTARTRCPEGCSIHHPAHRGSGTRA